MKKAEGQSDLVLLIGRIFYSSMFLLYGYFKFADYAYTVTAMGQKGLPAPTIFAILAIVVEFVGGLLMLVGYQTRIVALVLAICLLVSGILLLKDGAQLSLFMKDMAIVGGALAFFVSGAGAYSLDGRK
jgi:putative oxidoreductase